MRQAEPDSDFRRDVLAGRIGDELVAAEVARRITTVGAARSFIDGQKRAELVRDLTLIRTTIADRLGQTRPDLALDLMWRFIALVEPIMNRVDDRGGAVTAIFQAGYHDLGPLAVKARPDPLGLAEQVFAAATL